MAKPRPKPPTIILDNGSGDAQNLLDDLSVVKLFQKLVETVNRLYAEDGLEGLSLKLGRAYGGIFWWRRIALAEFRLGGVTLAEITVELYSESEVQIREDGYAAVKDMELFSSALCEILRRRAKVRRK